MNKNLFHKELKRNRRSLVVWTSIIAAFTIFVMTFFPAMKDMGTGMEMMMDSLPDAMKDAMGMTDSSWTSPLGFYSTYYSLHIMVLAGIFAMSTASNLLVKEEKEHTAEFLYTRPLKRSNIYFTKAITALTIVLILIVVQTVLGALGIVAFAGEQINWTDFAIMQINGAALVLFFACLGFFLPTLIKPKNNFMGISVGAVFGGYMINALSKTSKSTEWVGYISPFNHVDFAVTEPGFGISWLGICILIPLGLILVLFGDRLFNKKDFNT